MDSLSKLVVQPFGVLGSQLKLKDGQVAQVASEPSSTCAIIDPAGLDSIQKNGPKGAVGASASRSIYKWLGIGEATEFPEPVRAAIKKSLAAKFHTYGDGSAAKRCIHVVGPNFSTRIPGETSREQAVEELAKAYHSVGVEFHSSGLVHLRLLPISGGIFAGEFRDDLPGMTAQALRQGHAMLSEEEKAHWASAETLEMCIFSEADFKV
jgi:hypothetical protein